MSQNVCPLYAYAQGGRRCVLMPPEQWKQVAKTYLKYCTSGGSGCPVYSNYVAMLGAQPHR